MKIHRRIYWQLKKSLRQLRSWLYWVAFKGTGIPKNTKEWIHFSFEPSRLNLLGRYRRKRQKERTQKWMEGHVVHVFLSVGPLDRVLDCWVEDHEKEKGLS